MRAPPTPARPPRLALPCPRPPAQLPPLGLSPGRAFLAQPLRPPPTHRSLRDPAAPLRRTESPAGLHGDAPTHLRAALAARPSPAQRGAVPAAPLSSAFGRYFRVLPRAGHVTAGRGAIATEAEEQRQRGGSRGHASGS